jgi:putative DNA primase/helicase
MRLNADAVHSVLAGGGWARVLTRLGVPEDCVQLRRQQPCPVCGGSDRYVYDDRRGRGDFFCRKCGPGDGFALLMKLNKWTFMETRKRVIEVAGLGAVAAARVGIASRTVVPTAPAQPARPTQRVRDLLGGSCTSDAVPDVVEYLSSRRVWSLPQGCTLRAHASAEYFHDGRTVGRFAALVAPVVDIAGELVTVHVTYLDAGRKLATHEPRKILSGMTGRTGCAARLVPLTGDTLGIAEGIETALAALMLHKLPVWSALNTSLLSKFAPPKNVRKLVVFADRDEAGLVAAARLMESLQGRVTVELRVPPPPDKDWNDALTGRTP